jgi:hypothetical protein
MSSANSILPSIQNQSANPSATIRDRFRQQLEDELAGQPVEASIGQTLAVYPMLA